MTKWILGGFFVMGIYIFADVSNAIANYQLEDQRLALEKSKLEYKKDTYNSSSEGLEAQKQKHIFDMEDLKSKQEQALKLAQIQDARDDKRAVWEIECIKAAYAKDSKDMHKTEDGDRVFKIKACRASGEAIYGKK